MDNFPIDLIFGEDYPPQTVKIAGHVVRRLRWVRGWSAADLAQATQLSHDTILNIEGGRSKGTAKSAKLIADALGCNVEDIIVEPECEIPIGAVGEVVERDIA